MSLAMPMAMAMAMVLAAPTPVEPNAVASTNAVPSETAEARPSTETSEPTAPEPVRVVLVAPATIAVPLAARLEPQLMEMGYQPSFLRCEDFSCAEAPRQGEGARTIVVVVDEADALVIVTRGSLRDVVVDEVAVQRPLTTIDTEALGFAVGRGLTEPPSRLRTDWETAAQLGRRLAPPPPAASAEPVPAPASATTADADDAAAPPVTGSRTAFDRGAYVDLGIGSSSAIGGAFQLGGTLQVGAGFVFEGRSRSRLRLAVGAQAAHFGTFARTSGVFTGQARVALGIATARLMPTIHAAIGPSVAYGNYYGAPQTSGAATIGAGLRGRVSDRLTVGIEMGTTLDVQDLDPIVHGLLTTTWHWDVPRRSRSAR